MDLGLHRDWLDCVRILLWLVLWDGGRMENLESFGVTIVASVVRIALTDCQYCCDTLILLIADPRLVNMLWRWIGIA